MRKGKRKNIWGVPPILRAKKGRQETKEKGGNYASEP